MFSVHFPEEGLLFEYKVLQNDKEWHAGPK